METEQQVNILLVDDRPENLLATEVILASLGQRLVRASSGREALRFLLHEDAAVILLDVQMPDMDGFELAEAIRARERSQHTPIIFITGYADVYMSVQAMKAGAVEFLTKPYRDQELLEAVLAAIEKDRKRRSETRGLADLQRRFEALTARERQVMALTISGQQNKQIAGSAGISEVTVRVHRREIMRKMNAKSLAELVKMGELLRSQGVALGPEPLPDEGEH